MDDTSYMVSVKMITYNHVLYINKTIEGVLNQKTNFNFELVIGDDCSNDGTTKIIENFYQKYPDIIKPIIRKSNIGSKQNAQDLNKYLKGKYVALCEGDDYWIDPYKLQKQVDFMEANPDYSMCFHNALVIKEGTEKVELFANLEERDYSPHEILAKWIVPTASVLFRKKYLQNMQYDQNYIFTDIALFLTLCDYGKTRCIGRTMAVYRRHNTGLTQKKYSLKKKLKHFNSINRNFNYKYNNEIKIIKRSLYISALKNIIKKLMFYK